MRLTVGMLLAAVVAAALAFLANWTAREYPAPPGPAPQSDRRTVQAPDRARNAGTEPVQVLDRLPANIRDVTPAHVLPAPKIVEDVIVRIPAATAPVPPPRPRPHHWSRAIVVSGGVLKSGDTQMDASGNWRCAGFRDSLPALICRRNVDAGTTGFLGL